jgi:hypothetical protein
MLGNGVKKPLRAIDVTGNNGIYRSYRNVPYPEIERILINGGQAFVEGINRKTAFYAKNKLSKKLKLTVRAESRLIYADENKATPMQGYLFSVLGSESSNASHT